ncbi:hypothetical protein DXB79_00565 [Bacteroides fragilis]|nr:hypothetical protein F9003_06460 [Bacteroides fragilis]RGM88478.1 hypothetical protein DXB89_06840 [Bacteroides fragilis]RGN17061.1 hypothetical protein DXB79_00565 [Bacteroides fragilis]TWV51578.1 hypothetical protein FSA01_11120 [Bacteroides fragilis]
MILIIFLFAVSLFREATSSVEKVNATFTHSNEFFAIFVSGNLLFLKVIRGWTILRLFPGHRSFHSLSNQVNISNNPN